jgi:hypothetical protein
MRMNRCLRISNGAIKGSFSFARRRESGAHSSFSLSF